MPEKIPTEDYRKVFTDLQRLGQFGYVLAFVREEYDRWRTDLEQHLQHVLLIADTQRAEVVAIQGAIKAIAELDNKLRELSRPQE